MIQSFSYPAAIEFDTATSLSGGDAVVYREAARNLLYSRQFDKARELIVLAKKVKQNFAREEVKLLDLEMQTYAREMELYARSDLIADARSVILLMLEFLQNLDPKRVDNTFAGHLSTYVPALRKLADVRGVAEAQEVLKVIESKFGVVVDHRPVNSVTHLGKLKRSGLKTNFGFVESLTCPDTYISRRSVSPEIWSSLLSDAEIQFEREPGERGKAFNIALKA